MNRHFKLSPVISSISKNEQSHKKTPYISVFVITFTFEIIGIQKTKVPSHGSQTWLMSPMPERWDHYIWYVGRVWRYQRGDQKPSIEKGQTTNYNMTNNDQQKSSPKSASSVIGVWQYERAEMSRAPFLFSIKLLDVLIPIQKQRNYFEHSELCVLSVLDLVSYPKQLNNCHSSVIIQPKYNIAMNQWFTVFVKDTGISQIIQYYQIFIV
jgi:hypothetical protein